MPPDLAVRLHAAAADERRHVAACLAVAEADEPGDAYLDVPPVDSDDHRVRFACDVTYLQAAGETVAVALLGASVQPPCRDDLAGTLSATLADEQRHAALGWELLDAMLAAHPDVRPTLARLLPLQAVRVVRAAEAAAPEAGEDLRQWGVLPRGEVRRWRSRRLLRRWRCKPARPGVWSAPVQRENLRRQTPPLLLHREAKRPRPEPPSNPYPAGQVATHLGQQDVVEDVSAKAAEDDEVNRPGREPLREPSERCYRRLDPLHATESERALEPRRRVRSRSRPHHHAGAALCQLGEGPAPTLDPSMGCGLSTRVGTPARAGLTTHRCLPDRPAWPGRIPRARAQPPRPSPATTH